MINFKAHHYHNNEFKFHTVRSDNINEPDYVVTFVINRNENGGIVVVLLSAIFIDKPIRQHKVHLRRNKIFHCSIGESHWYRWYTLPSHSRFSFFLVS